MDILTKEQIPASSGYLKAGNLTSGHQWRTLRRMLANNTLVKLKRGLYRLNDMDTGGQMLEVANIIPSGIYCMFTAWSYYELTTYVPFEFHMAISQHKRVQTPDYPPVRLYYLTEKYYEMGVSEITVGGQKVRIYDLEKSVCDAVKFRNKAGLDTTIEVLKTYARRRDRNLNRLSQYAREMRIEQKMSDMIMPLV